MAGIPVQKQDRWWMLMLQAYFDGSQQKAPEIYVLAGYLASVEQWKGFSYRWQEILDLSPAIPYMRMADIRRRLGPHADERIALCRSAIEEFVPGGFSIVVRMDALRRVYGTKQRLGRNPFYFAFCKLVPLVVLNVHKFGMDEGDTIELIFDMEMSAEPEIMKAWNFARQHARVESPALKNMLSGSPIFRDDKKLLPLQAADLHAWWIRRRYLERDMGQAAMPLPGVSKNSVQYMRVEVTEDHLRQHELQRARPNN